MKKEFTLKSSFIEDARSTIHATVEDLTTAEKMNEWVSSATEGLISKLTEKVDESAAMVIANTIFFDGKWKEQFDEKFTHKADFFDFHENKETVNMMNQTSIFLHQNTSNYQAVVKDYGEKYEIIVVLPKEKSKEALVQVVKEIREDHYSLNTSFFSKGKAKLSLPRLDLQFSTVLGDSLKYLGVERVFTSSAQFLNLLEGKMKESKNVKLSQIFHKTAFRMNEKGTKCESMGLAMASASVVSTSPLFHLNANRPFLFFVKHKETQTLLFTGMVQRINE